MKIKDMAFDTELLIYLFSWDREREREIEDGWHREGQREKEGENES